jgi:predicted nuclease of predicted toxin-antitoxin system
MSRFLADENFPGIGVSRLRALGHDVTWMRTDAPGTADVDIVSMANHEARVSLTIDKDFGELAFHARAGAGRGVVLFRIPMSPPSQGIDAIVAAWQARDDWAGHFSVVERGRLRMRAMP